ncbi:helix-turn-helix domain-containing protein [Mucilaginibacter sp.]|uniref:helix-turn-helix domain-containing protein n=1 Tax=Mucilaginibacter sp. TaxID=1882438 RepID=UPI003D14847D
MLSFNNQQAQNIKELRADVKFRYLEEIIKDYIKEALTEFIKEQKEAEENKSPLLTIEDIARKFQVTKATVHNWKNKGSIVGKKFGKNRYFTEEEVRKSMAKFGFSKQWENRMDE